MTGAIARQRLNPHWVDEKQMAIGDVSFVVTFDLDDLKSYDSSSKRFLLGKARPMVDAMVEIRDHEDIRTIVDLGIFKGGSVALYAKLFDPEKLVAIEILPDPVPALSEFIAREGLDARVKPYYGVSQADAARVEAILASEFRDQDVDLVVDDASHYYSETRASFNLIFPYLRPGGIYVVEDWGWVHWAGDTWQKSEAFPQFLPALSNLLVEVCMLCASRPDLISSVHVTASTFVIRKGDARPPRQVRSGRALSLSRALVQAGPLKARMAAIDAADSVGSSGLHTAALASHNGFRQAWRNGICSVSTTNPSVRCRARPQSLVFGPGDR